MALLGSLIGYSFTTVLVTVDGRPIQGFWDGDDAVQIEPVTDATTPLVGADGASIISVSTNRAVNVTLRIMANSPGHSILSSKLSQLQLGIPTAFVFSVRDLTTGEGGSGSAFVTRPPTIQFGATASVREWQLFVSPFVRTNVLYTVI